MGLLTLIVTIVVVIAGVTFSLLNGEPVHINYYVGEQTLPLSLLLVLTLIIGVILGWLVGLVGKIRARAQIYRLRQQLKHFQSGKG